ncbi:hypothetical protein JCM5353_003094 [Sporobolomyces roseus]
MTAADELTALVNTILAQLPEGANPWAAIRAAFSAQVRPSLGIGFLAQLYTCSAIIALSNVFFIASLYLKWRQGTYWLFKTHRGRGGVYIVPHYSSCWITCFAIFYGILQGYLWKSIYFSRGDLVYDSALWRTLVWWSGYLAFFLAAWSLCVSHVLHLDSSDRPAKSFLAQAPFLNTFGILIIVASATSIAILGGASHIKYHSAMENYENIDAALSALEKIYNGKFDVAAFQSGTGFAIAEQFITDLASFGTYFRWTFIAYLIWTLLLEILLVSAGVLHLRELRRTMDELSNRTRVSPEAREQEKIIETTYNSLVYITYGVCIFLTAVNGIFAFVAAAGSKVVYIKSYSQAASLLPPFLFSALGLPLSILFFHQNYVSQQPAESSEAKSRPASVASRRPNDEFDSGITSILSTSQKPATNEIYPMTQMTTVPYTHDLSIPISPGSPNSTVESGGGGGGGGGAPASIDTENSEAHLYSTNRIQSQDQPFHSNYATRKPMDVEELQSAPSWGFRGRKG